MELSSGIFVFSDFVERRIIISVFGDNWCLYKIIFRRRRWRFPFEAGRAPRICGRLFSIKQRPKKINQRQQITDCQNARARRGKHVVDLKFRRVIVDAPRHSEIAQDKLRKKSQVESDEQNERGELREFFGIHSPGDFRPPIMQPAHERRDHPADHDVMKMRDDKISSVHMNIHRERRQKKSGESADDKKPDERKRVKHRRFKRNRAAIQRHRPIENFDGRRNRHEKTQERKNHSGVNGLAADKHVMSPNQKSNDGDGDAGKRDEIIAEDFFARKTGDDFADDAHARQNHDINRRMRIKPKQMLKQNRVAAEFGIENADAPKSFQRHERERDGQNGRRQNENDARRIHGPKKNRHPKPRQSRRAHFLDRDDEIQAGEDGAEAGDENSRGHFDDVRVRVSGAVRRVKSPAGVHAADDDGVHHEKSADHEKIPAQQIQFRKRDVARADHQRNDKISEHAGNGRNQKKPDHQHAVHREKFVVSFGKNEVALRREQFKPHHRGGNGGDGEEK